MLFLRWQLTVHNFLIDVWNFFPFLDYTKMANRIDHAFQKQMTKQFPEDKESNDADYVGEFETSKKKKKKKNPSETIVNKPNKQQVVGQEKSIEVNEKSSKTGKGQ